MARVTVEDCVLSVPNRFELCLIASRRARNIISGAPSELEYTGEKPTVLALREIGENMIDINTIKEDILTSIKNRDSSYVSAVAHTDSPAEDSKESAGESFTDQSVPNFVSENVEVDD